MVGGLLLHWRLRVSLDGHLALCELLLLGGRAPEPVSISEAVLVWFFLSELAVPLELGVILLTSSVDCELRHVLTTKCANHVEFGKLFSVLVN